MSCVISVPNIKRFSRALTALGKLGDVVYMDVTNDCFLLHTVNSARSAYGSFKFLPGFFSTYTLSANVNCKVSIKSCFMVFKSMASSDKTTEQCKFEFSNESDSLTIKLICKHDVVKVYTLPFIDCESLKTNFCTDMNKNFLSAEAKLFVETVQNFQSSVEEVTLKVAQDKVSLKNFTEDEKDPTKVVHTEVAYEIEEFYSHEFDTDSEITFCLKEFRAVLSFIEASSLPLKITFSEAGQPIAFIVENTGDLNMEVRFVMATLSECDSNEQSRESVRSSNRNITPSTQQTLPGTDNIPNTSVSAVVDLTLDDEPIPSTPPKKRLRNEFLGLTGGFPFTSMISQPDPVLAKDSDDEEEMED